MTPEEKKILKDRYSPVNKVIHRLPAMYEHYKDRESGKFSRPVWTQVITEFNALILDEMLTGKSFILYGDLGELFIAKVDNDYKKLKINWNKSNALKKELLAEGRKLWDKETQTGEKWLIYDIGEWYCRFFWSKRTAKVWNKHLYEFTPTRGTNAAKGKLYTLLKKDPVAHMNFKVTTVPEIKAEDVPD